MSFALCEIILFLIYIFKFSVIFQSEAAIPAEESAGWTIESSPAVNNGGTLPSTSANKVSSVLFLI